MRRRTELCRLVFALAWVVAAVRAGAQVLPSDTPESRNAGGRSSTLGPSPGAGSGGFGETPGDAAGILMNRPGRPGPRIPADITRPGRPSAAPAPSGIVPPTRAARITEAPLYGPLELPEGKDDAGPEDGLTLDAALDRLIRENPDLRTQFYEIPQAQADILTASLRANPLLYADATAIPYGSYSDARPGGQTQYDISITYPLDVTHKRRARTQVAARARSVLEAQYQDAVRLQVDNLYAAFVDVLAARETIRFSRASIKGLRLLEQRVGQLLKSGERTEADVNLIRVQLSSAEIGLREAFATYRSAKRRLVVLLNIPQSEVDALSVRGSIHPPDVPPPPDDQLVPMAMQSRPDLAAYRLGVARAEAEVRLANANRLSDVYLNYAPYVFQNNEPFNKLSAHSWSVAVTVPMPLYNRNQGNIARARLNVAQTRSGLDALEKQVAAEVLRADQEYDVTRAAIEQIEREIIPAARQVRDSSFRLFTVGEASILVYLEAQRDYNETVRQYRDMVVRHRRSMLDLNTALGRRVVP